MSSGRFAARCRASAAPIECPRIATRSHRSVSSVRARPASSAHCGQRVAARSSNEVPCPGSRGRRTEAPAPSNHSATVRSDAGEPPNPCKSSTPSGPSSDAYASEPARTVHRGRTLARARSLLEPPDPAVTGRSEPALAASGVQEQLSDEVEEEQPDDDDEHGEEAGEEPFEEPPRTSGGRGEDGREHRVQLYPLERRASGISRSCRWSERGCPP